MKFSSLLTLSTLLLSSCTWSSTGKSRPRHPRAFSYPQSKALDPRQAAAAATPKSFAGANNYFIHGADDATQDLWIKTLKDAGAKMVRLWGKYHPRARLCFNLTPDQSKVPS